MAEALSPTANASELFPEFGKLARWYRDEVSELTEAQLDFDSQEPNKEWMWWSIRRQTSHVASMIFRWLFMRWGDALWEGSAPHVDDLSGIADSPDDRRMDERTYWDISVIFAKLDEGVAFVQEALRRHTVAEARQKTITVPIRGEAAVLRPAHIDGFAPTAEDPTYWTFTLEATVRHMYFEALTHLYNIQRLKRAQGLAVHVNLPRVGYYVLPGWDNDLT